MPDRQPCLKRSWKKSRPNSWIIKVPGCPSPEVSHRSKWFDEVINDAVIRTKRLLNLGDDFEVLFIQGGASMQFCMVPMNLGRAGSCVDYLNTGTWSTKAIKEAQIQGLNVKVIASSEDENFSYIPKDYQVDGDAAYLHFTSNNTIKGTQFAEFPKTGGVPLVADMSSDIMSRPFDASPFGLIYAGAQKNIGPSGCALVIIRKDMLEREPVELPTILKYSTFASKNSMFNTPSLLRDLYHRPGPEMDRGDDRGPGGHGQVEPGKSRPDLRLPGKIGFLPSHGQTGQPFPDERDLPPAHAGA